LGNTRLSVSLGLSFLIHIFVLVMLDHLWASTQRQRLKLNSKPGQQQVVILDLVRPQESVSRNRLPAPIQEGTTSESMALKAPNQKLLQTRPSQRQPSDRSSSASAFSSRATEHSFSASKPIEMRADEITRKTNERTAESKQVEQLSVSPVEESAQSFDVKAFGQGFGRLLEQDSQRQGEARAVGRNSAVSTTMKSTFERHLKSFGQSWTEYRANDGTSWVRFSGGTCVKVPEFDNREHRHLNKTITLTDCPNS
jgi:hypothetical protein